MLGTIDADGGTRTSPVPFVPHRYRDLYWVSTPTSHHSHDLKRDNRLSAVIFDSLGDAHQRRGSLAMGAFWRTLKLALLLRPPASRETY